MRAAVITALALIACDYEQKVPPTELPDETKATVTYQRDVRPIVEQHCNGCHAEGGIAPTSFEDPITIAHMAPIIAGFVASGEMPPWPMNPSCRDVRNARVLPDADKAMFAAWADAGYAMGDAADFVARATVAAPTLGANGLALTRSDGYSPDASDSDDYRCFLFPQTIASASWIRGVRIDPDEKPVVHHVLLFMVPPEAVPALEAKDADAAGAGYPCQGGSGADGDTLVAGWVPGSVPTLFPETAAIAAPQGARFVMQMHYNTLNVDRSKPIAEDTTGGWLELMPAGQTPSHVIAMRPLLDPVLAIQPNDAAAVEGMSFSVRWAGQVVGVTPHMHTRGAEIRVTKTAAAGGETCIADIPRWDFHWQQTYVFEPESYVAFDAGDSVSIECIYDNSEANQPVIDGEQVEPSLVKWGEETTDEMCLAYVMVMTPFDGTPEPEGPCTNFGPCYAACAEGDAQCAIGCLLSDGQTCAQCGVSELFTTCGQDQCPSQSASLTSCLATCDGTKLACAANECKTQSAALYGCLETPLRTGFCDGPCGIEVTP